MIGHTNKETVLVIACGALANEILALKEINGLAHITLDCLPASYHNTPDLIPDVLRRKIHESRGNYDKVFVGYGDCGTGGIIDRMLEKEGVERIGGAHCYAFFAGLDAFEALHDEEPGTFYLTDFLVRHFDSLVIKGMGIDRYPELRDMYFANYTRLVYLAQTDDPELTGQAEHAAQQLELAFVRRFTGYGDLGMAMQAL